MSDGLTERNHALDAVRGTALLLGIFFHASASFLPGNQMWIIMDSERSVAMGVTFYVLHVFRMATFFLLAGYFGRMLWHRLGAGGFLRDRLRRIAVPLVFGWPVMMAAFTALIVLAVLVQNNGVIPEDLPPPPPITWQTLPLTHLWFLYVLLIYYAAVIVIRAPIALLDRGEVLRGAVDRVLSFLFRTPLVLVVVALPGTVALGSHANWVQWFGLPTPEAGIVPNTPALVAYGSAFALGWLMQRRPELLERLARGWLLWLVLAAFLTGLSLKLAGVTPSFTLARPGPVQFLHAACYILAMWSGVFAFIGLGQRFFARHSALRRYLADSAYWLYLIHLPIVIGLQIWVSAWQLPWGVKYAVILALALPPMLVSYHLMVRGRFIGRILHGNKRKVSVS